MAALAEPANILALRLEAADLQSGPSTLGRPAHIVPNRIRFAAHGRGRGTREQDDKIGHDR
jgi:hypothetical protein